MNKPEENVQAERLQSRPVGKPTLPDDQALRVVGIMRELCSDKFDGNASAMARALKVSQPTISAILGRRHNPSFEMVGRVAEIVGKPVMEILTGSPVGAPMVSAMSHPQLFAALTQVGEHVTAETRNRVTSAAALLPDMARGTWVTVLLDDAHARTSSSAAPSAGADQPLSGSRVRHAKTLEVPVTALVDPKRR